MKALDVRRMVLVFGLAGLALSLGACSSEPTESRMTSAALKARSGSQAEGHVHFHQVGDDINVAYEVKNLVPNSKHGFHVHEKGDCSAADASSAGGHFNPGHAEHGDPNMPTHHAGDMGNITANDKGVAKGEMTLKNMKASSLLGTAVVVHEKEDDEKTQPTGNSGSRIACGVVVQ